MAKKVTLKIQETDSLAKQITENFKLMPSVVSGNSIDSDTAQVLDDFARGIVGLTTNTYKEVFVTTEESVTEILAE